MRSERPAGETLGSLLPATEDALAVGNEAVLQRLLGGAAVSLTTPREDHEAGDLTWLIWSLSADSAVPLLLLIGHDSEVQAEPELPVKRELLAQLLHELRGPLAPMRAAIDLLDVREPQLLERVRAVLVRQVEMMSRLLCDLNELTWGDRAVLALRRRRTAVDTLVQHAVELARPALDARRHVLDLHVERGLLVDADPSRLVQVLANLLTNAAKYTAAGGQITLDARMAHDQLVLSVRDNGIGIAADALPHVFDAFVRTSRARRTEADGFGLGLSVVRAIVLQHGGSVEAHSDGPDRGSRFVVTLPAAAQTV